MIFLATRKATGAIEGWLETADRARDLAGRMRVREWEDLPIQPTLQGQVTVLTDFERFYPAQHELATVVWQSLGEARVPRLNDPARVLCRPALLACLHREGLNEFRAAGADDDLSGLRYPVFVREANEHTGSLTALLEGRTKLNRALSVLTRFGGFSHSELLVVEFCDTRDDDGKYRKYSAIRLGDHTLARALTFSDHWMVKDTNRIVDEEIAAKELAFIQGHPHRDWVERVFDLAGIEYGRVDYAVLDGRPQAWEINTNPQIGPRAKRDGGRRPRNAGYWMRQEGKGHFHEAFRQLLRTLCDQDEVGIDSIPVSISPDLARRLRTEARRRRWRDRVRTAFYRLRRSDSLRRVVRVTARTR